ncbi:hypothetical protein [Ruminococcus sp.]|uniref:hypothetical protein n=1 Tax=Ruminococcus sp. TaxID=41978 RepID=UPI00386FA07D
MEFRESLELLRRRLDGSLKDHAEKTDHNDIGDIYRLQEYSETHYYMKAAHDYTPAEVEALLAFVDPLEVAFWCREESTHKVGLPICEILKEINADARFEKFEPELSLKEKTAKLISRLDNNLYSFLDILNQLDFEDITQRSERIAATWAAHSYMTDELLSDNIDESLIDHLLSKNDPLQYLTDHWPECTLFGVDVIADIQDEIKEKKSQHEQPKSVHERLKNASRAVSEQVKPEKPLRGDGAR